MTRTQIICIRLAMLALVLGAWEWLPRAGIVNPLLLPPLSDVLVMLVQLIRRPMVQEAFSDYHLYTLDRKTTINNAETKQVSMLSGANVPVRKRYVVEGQQWYYHNGRHPGAPFRDVVQVSDDAGLEGGLALFRGHLIERGGGDDTHGVRLL